MNRTNGRCRRSLAAERVDGAGGARTRSGAPHASRGGRGLGPRRGVVRQLRRRRGATGLPARPRLPPQLRVRPGGRGVPGRADRRSVVRDGVLGRGADLQPSAVGRGRRRRRTPRARTAGRRARRAAGEGRHAARARVRRGHRSAVRRRHAARAGARVLGRDACRGPRVSGRPGCVVVRRARLDVRGLRRRSRGGRAAGRPRCRRRLRAAGVHRQPEPSRRRALPDSRLRQPGVGGARARGGAALRADRARGRARAAHALAHLRAARPVARHRGVERAVVGRVGEGSGGAEADQRRPELPRLAVPAVRRPAARPVSCVARRIAKAREPRWPASI